MSNELISSNSGLTVKNRLFLEHLADGKAVIEAYRQAGYKGSYHAAYELKSQLKGELVKVLEAKGFSREGLAGEILKLNQLPLADVYKQGINLNQKLSILKLLNSALPKQAESKVGQVTVLNFGRTPEGKTVIKSEAIEAEVKES
jgi:hypothetical protein